MGGGVTSGGRRGPIPGFAVLFALAVAAMFALMGYFAFGQAMLRHDLAERGVTVDARVLDEERPHGGGMNATVSYPVDGTRMTSQLASYHSSAISMTPQIRYDPEDPARVMLASDVDDPVQAYGAVAQALFWMALSLAAAVGLARQERRESPATTADPAE
ncbi:DUF3592 domain-containing protein [Catellatospora methionotrophica]|uniref:DUF3592 domain-containing protein n=1 Tax=Catellatospora methionotrophica TaxID=121620 RepID=UPI0033D01A59